MTVCIPIDPEHTEDGNKEAQFGNPGRFAFRSADLPIQKLRNAEQQKHQPIDKIRAQQKRPTINSSPEQKGSSGHRGINRAKFAPVMKAGYGDNGSTDQDRGSGGYTWRKNCSL